MKGAVAGIIREILCLGTETTAHDHHIIRMGAVVAVIDIEGVVKTRTRGPEGKLSPHDMTHRISSLRKRC